MALREDVADRSRDTATSSTSCTRPCCQDGADNQREDVREHLRQGQRGDGTARALATADRGGRVGPRRGDAAAGAATRMVERLLDVGIDGRGPFDSAQRVADVAVADHVDADRAIDARRAQPPAARRGRRLPHRARAASSRCRVALPANVAGVLPRGDAHGGVPSRRARGYDIRRPEVRSAVLLALVGADADDLLSSAGLRPSAFSPTGRLADLAAQRLPGPALMVVNKGVGFRLLTQVGKKSLTRLGKAVPDGRRRARRRARHLPAAAGSPTTPGTSSRCASQPLGR